VPPVELVAPCTRSQVDAPVPDTATLTDIRGYIVTLAGRLEGCADQIDAIRVWIGSASK